MNARDRLVALLLRLPQPKIVLEMRAALVLGGHERDWRWTVRAITPAEQQKVLRSWLYYGLLQDGFITVHGGFLALVEGERPLFTDRTAAWAVWRRAEIECDALNRLTPHFPKEKSECSPE